MAMVRPKGSKAERRRGHADMLRYCSRKPNKKQKYNGYRQGERIGSHMRLPCGSGGLHLGWKPLAIDVGDSSKLAHVVFVMAV